MKNRKIFLFTIFAFFILSKSYSQGNGSIHVGTSFPLSEFKNHDSHLNGHGGAATGFNAGIDYVYPLAKSNFGIFGGMDMIYNPFQKDYQDNIVFYYGSMRISTKDTKYSSYMNFPITTGLNYTFCNDQIGISANAGLVFNLFKIGDMQIHVYDETLTNVSALATSVGYKIGCGLIFQNIILSIDYLGLGEHIIESHVERKGYVETVPNATYTLKVNLINVTLGYRIK